MHRKWIEGKLNYSNVPSLMRRLREVYERHPQGVASVVGDRNSFIQRVATARNYHTHFDKGLEGRAAWRGDLYGLTRRLKLLLEVRVLGGMGFDDGRTKNLLARRSQP